MLKRISQAEYSRSYSGKPERLGNRWMKHRLLVERRYNKVIDVGLSDHARFHLLRWAAHSPSRVPSTWQWPAVRGFS